MSLLEEAMSYDPQKRSKASKEDIELAFAWLRNEVRNVQVAAAYGVTAKQGGAILYKIANALKSAYQRGMIDIKD